MVLPAKRHRHRHRHSLFVSMFNIIHCLSNDLQLQHLTVLHASVNQVQILDGTENLVATACWLGSSRCSESGLGR
jgi:hypothetical protein